MRIRDFTCLVLLIGLLQACSSATISSTPTATNSLEPTATGVIIANSSPTPTETEQPVPTPTLPSSTAIPQSTPTPVPTTTPTPVVSSNSFISSWDDPNNNYSASDRNAITQYLQIQFTSSYTLQSGDILTVTNIQRQGDWSTFTLNIADANAVIQYEIYFLAHVQNGAWTVVSPAAQIFCSLLAQAVAQAPPAVVSQQDEAYFC